MTENKRPTKNEKRRQKKKLANQQAKTVESNGTASSSSSSSSSSSNGHHNVSAGDDDIQVQVEYVSADLSKELTSFDNSLLDQFKAVIEKFARPEDLTTQSLISSSAKDGDSSSGQDVSQTIITTDEDGNEQLSRRKKKLMSRLSVAELKQLVQRPDVVEAHDVTASDPRLLVYLKAYRNTVQVPRHWCHKSKYLQRKRGIEKPPFQLPEFIADTGISKIRASVMEQEALKKSKQKARDRMQPRMGKIDIDYQVLHDAFFKYQTKPKLVGHGDLYYEGKEFEVDMKQHKAGVLSSDLLAGLGMTDRSSAPPPWLINMQRYGPPPSYPHMKIPGLNAPIPAGASFGYHPGGWGKPPVDEYGRPLYGDVFGVTEPEEELIVVDRTTKWGEIIEIEVEEEEEEEEEGEEEEDIGGMETPMTMDGSVGATLLSSGIETPDTIMDLRKRAGLETPDSTVTRELYQVIQEKTSHAGSSGQLFGSDKTYVLGKSGSAEDEGAEGGAGLAGESTDYEETGGDAKGTKKRRRVDDNIAAKKYKDFKF